MSECVCVCVCVEHLWNVIDKGKLKYSEKKNCQCHFCSKSHIEWPRINAAYPR